MVAGGSSRGSGRRVLRAAAACAACAAPWCHPGAAFAAAAGRWSSGSAMPSTADVAAAAAASPCGAAVASPVAAAQVGGAVTAAAFAVALRGLRGRKSPAQHRRSAAAATAPSAPIGHEEDVLYNGFHMVDVNKDGVINLQELRLMLSGKGPLTAVLPDGKTVEQVLAEVDTSHDGVISFEEFKASAGSSLADLSSTVAAGFERVVQEAMEFAQNADDGVQPKLWEEADVLLLGPSRTGKTTLANYLARLGLKVANYPLVPGEEPPPELLQLDQSKVIKLTTQPEQLQAIRQERMQRLGRSVSAYATFDNIRRELSWVKTFYIRNFPRMPVIDTAKWTLAESAALITAQIGVQMGTAGIDTDMLAGAAQSAAATIV